MNKRKIEEFLREFDEEVEIVVIDSLGSEFSIDKIESHKDKVAIILKRSYDTNNNQLLLKLEKDRYGKR